jgi:hypothetical protein
MEKPYPLLCAILFLGVLGCSSAREREIAATGNQSAWLVGDLPANPLQWKVITASVDKNHSTMSTLFGNDVAVRYARANSGHDYAEGAVLSLVTWAQQEDGRWFGAKIPSRPKSVEFVFVRTATDGRLSYSYQKYEGALLKRTVDQLVPAPNDRATFLLSQRAAVMP